MAKTKTPGGLTVARSGGLYLVCNWKISDADHGEGQQLQWKTNLKNSWTTVPIAAHVTGKTIALDYSSFYPNTSKCLKTFSFRIRGKRKRTTDSKTNKTTIYDWSGWNQCDYAIQIPLTPVIQAELDSERENVTTFTWTTEYSYTDHRPQTRLYYQTMLIKDCGYTDGSKLTWKSSKLGWGEGTGGRDGSLTKTEDTALLAVGSYTRWVRVRMTGPGGTTAWKYAKHVYAKPYAGKISSAKVASVSGGVTTVQVTWQIGSNAAHPIDRVLVQYKIDTPGAGRTPTGEGWSTAATIADTSGNDSAKISIDNIVGVDQCLWVRVAAVHDKQETYSPAYLVRSGSLTAPSDLTVSADSGTYRATVGASNNSEVPDSKLAVVFRKQGQDDYVCGIISGTEPINIKCAPWADATAISFGVYAFQGSYKSSSRADGTTQYAVTANMKSSTVWGGGTVPAAPTGVVASISAEGEVLLTWGWNWNKANRAEVSWSQNEYAWESTEPPQSYLIESIHAAKIRVPNLQTGTTWYFRVRLASATAEELVYGPYSDTVAVNLASAPLKPVLSLSANVVPQDQTISASWSYDTTDGTAQRYAEIWLAEVDGDNVTRVRRVAKTTTARSVTIPAGLAPTGSTYYLCVQVLSESGLQSDWSDPVPVSIADPPSCDISATSLEQLELQDDEGNEREVTALTAMPLTVTVVGAGAGGITAVSIERAEAYQMDRPDESVFQGYEGETIAVISQIGEDQITIDGEDLVGLLDDGAAYRIIATTQDGFGQSATASIDFEVHWSHQAVMPEAVVEADEENMVMLITPIAPDGAQQGDVCDIYRLSADRPELIIEGGAWGVRYVDPYPAIGEFGGHRIVFRTVNGDYITQDNHPAWIDLGAGDGDLLERQDTIIDFDGDRVQLPYNLNISSKWDKDFQETQYLGGAVQGDWNPAVSRSGSIGTVSIVSSDQETILAMRRLARYAGVCHVRTPEGSSYAADVQVSESRDLGLLVSFTLTITRVDAEGMDGLPYDEWAAEEEG